MSFENDCSNNTIYKLEVINLELSVILPNNDTCLYMLRKLQYLLWI